MAQKKVQTNKENVKDKEVAALEKKVNTSKKSLATLKKELDSTKAEYDKTLARHVKRVQALKDSNAKIKENILADGGRIEKDLINLAKKQEQFQAEHDADQVYFTKKIEELKQKRKDLLLKENETETKTFNKKKAELEKQLNSLRENRAKQTEVFDKKMAELKETYDQLLNEKRNEISIVRTKLEEESERAKNEAAELERRRAEQLRKQQEEAERQRKEQEELLEKLNNEKQEAINELNAQLNSINSEYDSVMSFKESLSNQLNALKTANDNEYNEMVMNFENENNRLINEYNIKSNELKQAQDKLEETIKAYRNSYETRTREIDEVNKLLEERKYSRKQSVVKAIDELDASLKAKRSDFLDYVDQQVEQERKNRETDLETIKYNLSQEELQLKNRNDYYSVRFAKKEEEFKNDLEENSRQLEELRASLLNAEHAHAERKNEMENSLNKMKDDHYLMLEKNNKDSLSAYQNRKVELSDKENRLITAIGNVRSGILEQNALVEEIKKEIEAVKADYERKKNDLIAKHEIFVNDADSQRKYLEEQMATVTRNLEEKTASHQVEMNELDEIEAKKRSEYENEIQAIEEDFAKRKSALEEKNSEDIRQLNEQHEKAMADIVAKYNANVEYVESLYNDKRNEYENERNSIDEYAANIAKETEEKLSQFEAQRAQILESIEQLKAEKIKDDEEYSANVASIEDLYRRQLEEVNLHHTERMNDLNSKYESKNLEGILAEVTSELNSKQLEFTNLQSELDRNAKQFTIDIERLQTEFNLKKQELEDDLRHSEEIFEQEKQNAEKTENDVQNVLVQRQASLREYQDEIAEKIASIKAVKQADYNSHEALLNEQAKDIEEKLEEKRLNAQNSYDSKIETIRKQYELKSEQYNTLLEDIAAKKETFINEQKNKYDQQISFTDLLQQRMNEVVEQNGVHRNELMNKIDEKRQEMSEKLEALKNQLHEAFEKQNQSYEEYLASMNAKCDQLRGEIFDLENIVNQKRAEFEEYAANKKQEITDIKDYNKNYLDELRYSIKLLEDKKDEAQAIHLARVNETKKQIANAMSEYDDLLKNAPSIIEGETATFADLQKATVQFKNRIDAMEQQYAGIMAELDEEKIAIIKAIEEDITSLDEDSRVRNEEHDAELKEIYCTYERMIAEEKAKQEVLNNQLETIKNQHDIELSQIDAQSKALPTEYENNARELMKEFNLKMKENSEQFKNASDSMKAEFEEMLGNRTKLSNKIRSISEAYSNLDAEIEKGKTNLQIVTRKLMNDILVNVERKANERRKLSSLDAMSNKNH